MATQQSVTARRNAHSPDDGGSAALLAGPLPLDYRDGRVMAAPERLVFAGVVVLLLVLAAVGAIVGATGLQGVTVTVFLLAGLGIPPVLLLAPMTRLWFCLLALSTSLATTTAVGFLMSATHVWIPVPAFVAVALASAALLVTPVRRDLAELRNRAPAVASPSSPRETPASLIVGAATAVGVLIAVIAAAISRGDPQPAGLFATISPLWYLGLVILIAAAVWAHRVSVSLAAPVLALSGVVVLSQALMYGSPAVMSAARHVGIVDFIRVNGGAQGNLDIYQAWSGLFAGIAWLADAADISDTMSVATWWPVLLSPALALAIAALASRWFTGRTRVWIAALLFSLAGTLNITYFSPQSVGLFFGLVIFALAVGPRVPRGSQAPVPADRIMVGPLPLGRLLMIAYLSIVMAVTHQISPYLTVAALVILVVFGFVRPWWIPLVVLVPAVVFALLHTQVLGNFVSLGAIGQFWNNVQPPSHSFQQYPTPLSTTLAFYAPAAVLLLVGVAAVVTVIRARSRAALALLVAAASPVSLILATDYGQEGIFRASLFALPWLSVLAAATLWTWTRTALPALAAALVILLGVNVYGQTALDWNRVPSQDLSQATLFYETTAPEGSVMLMTGTGNAAPQARTARYRDVSYASRESLDGYPAPSDRYNAVADVRDLTTSLTSAISAPRYFALVSMSIGAYDERYGFQSYSDYQELASAMASSRDWNPVYTSPTAIVYELVEN